MDGISSVAAVCCTHTLHQLLQTDRQTDRQRDIKTDRHTQIYILCVSVTQPYLDLLH